MNINQKNFDVMNMNFSSKDEKSSSILKTKRLSFENIRIFRQHFEQGSSQLRPVLGENEHQTMMVAMFEGTEKLLNKSVSEFAVIEYLEGLKLAAKELRLKGVSGEKFRISLIDHSDSSVRNLMSSH